MNQYINEKNGYVLLETLSKEVNLSMSFLQKSRIVKKHIKKINNRLLIDKEFYESYKNDILERRNIKKPEWIVRDGNT